MTITKEHLAFYAVHGIIFLVFARWQLALVDPSPYGPGRGDYEISEALPLMLATLLLLTASNFYWVNLFRPQKVVGRAVVYLVAAIFGAVVWGMIVSSLVGNPPLLLSLFLVQLFGLYFMPVAFLIILGTVFGVEIVLWRLKFGASGKRDKFIFLSIGLVWTICLFALPGLSYIALGSPYLGG